MQTLRNQNVAHNQRLGTNGALAIRVYAPDDGTNANPNNLIATQIVTGDRRGDTFVLRVGEIVSVEGCSLVEMKRIAGGGTETYNIDLFFEKDLKIRGILL